MPECNSTEYSAPTQRYRHKIMEKPFYKLSASIQSTTLHFSAFRPNNLLWTLPLQVHGDNDVQWNWHDFSFDIWSRSRIRFWIRDTIAVTTIIVFNFYKSEAKQLRNEKRTKKRANSDKKLFSLFHCWTREEQRQRQCCTISTSSSINISKLLLITNDKDMDMDCASWTIMSREESNFGFWLAI